MTRVLVSGGTGIVGRFIVEHLLASGYKVTVAGRTPPAAALFSKPVAFVPLSLDPDADQIEAFDNIYYFVHAAFDHLPGRYRGGEGNDPQGFHARNLDGTVRLFEAAKDAGVRRTCFLSSRAAYGTQPPGMMLTEDLTCKPDTLYGTVKLHGERSLLSLCGHGFVTASLRVTGVYGPGRPGQPHKWQSLIDDYLAGTVIQPRVGTEVHGDDVGKAVRLMLETDAIRISGETFNVSDVLIDNRTILAPLQQQTHCPHPLPDAADTSAYNVMNTCKIGALGWKPGGRERLMETLRGDSHLLA
ncbi:NAD-dependent epimerase/dehydratase family protein [Pararhizobium antarcticum]|uniref:UDP-glucose 4-epimerase n=1 Tax=Pararhizobium antarcticum TaxID=1798805 RepID=A0A657LP01_9HYPH|nr:NAD(P)-dependent oxidoreductase [Pararhizobium antarcticum]OJF92218.1 UDP-glucose 4-epimerase [Pararhizobium antarcticum]OJF94899.1 UDP-glucose 4-epimerase [Rhizobium sp. 58]